MAEADAVNRFCQKRPGRHDGERDDRDDGLETTGGSSESTYEYRTKLDIMVPGVGKGV